MAGDKDGKPSERPVFLPVILAGVLVLVGLYVAVHLGLVSRGFMARLNQAEAPLGRADIPLGPSPPRLARRVVLIIIDGLRLRDSYGLPYLDNLRRQGVDARAVSHYPSFSRPNYVTLVTGVPPAASGARTNAFATPVRLDSLMDRVAAAGMKAGFAADYTNGLPLLFTRPAATSGAGFQSSFYDAVMTTWPGGLELAVQRMIGAGYPLLVVVPGSVDMAGHEHGGDSPEYRAAAQEVDSMLARALAGLDLERDVVIITADHGHTDQGGHGGVEPEVMEVPLIMVGKGVRRSAAVTDAELIDVAPTAAALLGLPSPRQAMGHALTQALGVSPDAQHTIEQADAARTERARAVVAAWRVQGAGAVSYRRTWRAPLVLLLIALGVGLVFAARRAGALQIDWRVLAFALPAFPVSYYAMLAFFGQTFSPSFVPARGDLAADLFRFGLLSTAAHVVASWFAFRGRVVLSERLATANGLFVCGLLSSLAAVATIWASWPGPFIDVPSPRLVVLIPATYMACACFSLAVVTTLVLEIVIFFARAVDPRQWRPQLRMRRPANTEP